MRLIPINTGRGIVYMTEQEAIAQGYLEDPTLNLFGSKRKRQRTEQKVHQATQAAQQNNAIINDVTSKFTQVIPGLQNELKRASAELNRVQTTAGTKANNTIGYLSLGVALLGTGYTIYQKLSNQNS